MSHSTIKSLISFSAILLILSGCGESANKGETIAGVTPDPDEPNVYLSSNSYHINYNDSITLSWRSTETNSCVTNGSWSGNKPITGSETIGPLTENVTFSLSCTGEKGVATDSVTIIVDEAIPNFPTLSLQSSVDTVNFNGTTVLNWSSSNTNSCIASGDWSGDKNIAGSETINSITTNSTYILSCTGDEGTANYSVNVTVVVPEIPVISLTASSENVPDNGSTTLSWTSSDATSCTASGDWSGNKGTSGSETIDSIVSDSTFTLSCTGFGGTANSSIDVNVVIPQLPVVSLTASSVNVESNGSTVLSWTSSDATSCTASGDWSGSKSTSGSETVDSIISDSTFTLSCTGFGGSANSSIDVTAVFPELPVISLTASPVNVESNGSTVLSWTSSDATSCTASGGWSGSKSTSGSETIDSIIADSTYTLSCSGAGGTVNDSVNVTVIANNTGTALLSWMPPTTNTDGSALNDLAGYKIYYGTESGNYTETITVNNSGLSSYFVDDLLTNNTWYFAVSSFNSASVESLLSGEVSKNVN